MGPLHQSVTKAGRRTSSMMTTTPLRRRCLFLVALIVVSASALVLQSHTTSAFVPIVPICSQPSSLASRQRLLASGDEDETIPSLSSTTTTTEEEKEKEDDQISNLCMGINSFGKQLVIQPVREYVEIQPSGTSPSDFLSKITARPEVPGIPRPVWLTVAASVPTALGWYGYYKFCVEEELFEYELRTEGKVRGCGGAGSLIAFSYAIIVGFPISIIFHNDFILQAGALWILLGQVNLYHRVNELCWEEREALEISEPPLYSWWALLPPPLDVVVGLRQVHFLSEFWRVKRGEEYQKDILAEELFPFISSERFTLKEFFRTPSNWFWFTKDWDDFDFEILQDNTQAPESAAATSDTVRSEN